MTPVAITAEAKAAGLKNVAMPTCSVAGKAIDNGAKPAASPSTCASMRSRRPAAWSTPRWASTSTRRGKPTSDKTAAAIDPATKKPVPNAARNIWVTETALSTALNTSYFAENVALFSIVMGAALLLTGIGFLVVTLGLLGAAARKEDEVVSPEPAATPAPAV